MPQSNPPALQARPKPFDLVVHAFKLLYDRLPGSYNLLVGLLGYRAPELVADALGRHHDGSATILDAGCGTGLTARAVKDRLPGATLDGFDLSADMLELAKGSGHYRALKSADATQPLPFAADSYDAAVSSGLYTLGHVGPEALAPVLACVKPGGLFALNIYDAAWEKLQFGPAVDALAADDLVTVEELTNATHFGRIGQTCRVLVLRKAGAAAQG
ncbi:MAG: class I SAM-dependent methyltransferase [Devosiaceae bacterium]|nr:class I SAM-dependent methyltransferase [Devosiaceae bacterium MH13]